MKVVWCGDSGVRIFRANKISDPCHDVAEVGGWTNLTSGIGSGVSHDWWLTVLLDFRKNNTKYLVHVGDGVYKYPTEYICIVHSNLNCCYTQSGTWTGITERHMITLQALIQEMRYFHAPIIHMLGDGADLGA